MNFTVIHTSKYLSPCTPTMHCPNNESLLWQGEIELVAGRFWLVKKNCAHRNRSIICYCCGLWVDPNPNPFCHTCMAGEKKGRIKCNAEELQTNAVVSLTRTLVRVDVNPYFFQ